MRKFFSFQTIIWLLHFHKFLLDRGSTKWEQVISIEAGVNITTHPLEQWFPEQQTLTTLASFYRIEKFNSRSVSMISLFHCGCGWILTAHQSGCSFFARICIATTRNHLNLAMISFAFVFLYLYLYLHRSNKKPFEFGPDLLCLGLCVYFKDICILWLPTFTCILAKR